MWTAIIGAAATIIGGLLSYYSNQSAQGQAQKIAAQNRSDILRQQNITNKQADDAVAFDRQRFGFGVAQQGLENTRTQQATNRDEIAAAQKSAVDKVNQSGNLRAQLLSLWK
jgi:hypothetical protein